MPNVKEEVARTPLLTTKCFCRLPRLPSIFSKYDGLEAEASHHCCCHEKEADLEMENGLAQLCRAILALLERAVTGVPKSMLEPDSGVI
jgi:hypothetical protein